MRRAASGLFAAAAVLAAAGCGSSSPKVDRTFAEFLRSPRGAAWAKRFPHHPGSRPCTAFDPKLARRVPATCSTALSLGEHELVVATFTVSWSHGNSARTWFVFLRRGGEVDHVSREGSTA